jgi:Na+/melibiose symporter-like transporter
VLLFLPLALGAAVGGISIMLATILGLLYLPDNTPMEKRGFIPTITNISSVMWNSQFRVFLGAIIFISFLSSTTPLLLFFFRFVMDLSSEQAASYNIACIIAFFIAGLLSLPVTPYFLRRFGKLTVLRTVLLILAALGLAKLGISYWSPIGIVVTYAIVGFVATCAGISVGIISADVVDYDELLCGKKRSSSYQAVLQPLGYFVGIASSSIPLAIMGATGFEEGVRRFQTVYTHVYGCHVTP